MKKMMLIAVMVALAALMLAAAPALATHREGHQCTPSENHPCPDENGDHDDDDDDDDGDDGNNIDSRLINRLNDVGNLEVSPTFEASQETEQDCDSGDASVPIDVNSGGDNSVTTVGINPSVNTGCAQTAVDVLEFNPTLGVQGGDFAFNADQNNVIVDNDCDGEDDDGDGRHDEDNFNCDDNGDDNGNHNGNHDDDNGDDNGDDNSVEINDRDSFRFGGDRQTVTGGGGGDIDLEEIGSSIGVGGDQVIKGGGAVEQAAAASNTEVVFPWWLVVK